MENFDNLPIAELYGIDDGWGIVGGQHLSVLAVKSIPNSSGLGRALLSPANGVSKIIT